MIIALTKYPGVLAGVTGAAWLADVVGLKGVSTLIQFGALGLCAFMCYGVWRILESHRKERAELVESLKAKEDKLETFLETTLQANHENAIAMTKLAEALGDRPCLHGDSRFKKPQ